MEKESQDVDLTIPILPQMELTATKTAEAVGAFMKLDEEKIDEIKLALVEACINAFEHSQSADGRIGINFEIGQDQLTLTLSDKGQGFDMDRVQAEAEKRHRTNKRRGWGLAIMKELMDEVRVDSGENGTTITMVKRR